MIVREHLIKREIFAETDIPEETKACSLSNFFVLSGYSFDLLMVRCNPATDESVWSREPVKEVNSHLEISLLEQFLNRIEASGTSANDEQRRRGVGGFAEAGLPEWTGSRPMIPCIPLPCGGNGIQLAFCSSLGFAAKSKRRSFS